MNHHENVFEGLTIATIKDETIEAIEAEIQARNGHTEVFDFDTGDSSRDSSIAEFANRLLTANIEAVVFVTGVGVDYVVDQAARNVDRQRFIDCLKDVTTVAGSQAAGIALQRLGVAPTVCVETPSSWREILMAIDRSAPVVNQTVALEESNAVYGLTSGLEARGAKVVRLPIFVQKLPQRPHPAIDFFEQIEAGDFHAILFTSPGNAAKYCFLAKHFGRARLTNHLLDNHIVLSVGSDTAEILQDRGIAVDYSTQEKSIAGAMAEIAAQLGQIRKQKNIIRINMSGPSSSTTDPSAPWYNSPFMKACRGEPTDVTPIWMMRQAGRYMAEYRAVRDKVSFLELCANPQLCSEVMCTAVNRLGVDAAIIFSDLLPILVPMGCDLEFVKGDGPVIHNPVRTGQDLDRIKPLESNEPLQFVMETVRQTRMDLPADMPLIGFAGAPFTLASYMIEGGASRNYAFTKTLMYSDRGAWNQLMQILSQFDFNLFEWPNRSRRPVRSVVRLVGRVFEF